MYFGLETSSRLKWLPYYSRISHRSSSLSLRGPLLEIWMEFVGLATTQYNVVYTNTYKPVPNYSGGKVNIVWGP